MVAKGHCADAGRDWSDPTLPSKERCNSLRAAKGLGSCSFVLSLVWMIVDSIVMDHYIVGALLAMLTFSATWLMFDTGVHSSVLDTKHLYVILGGSWLLVLAMVVRNWRIAATIILAAFQYHESPMVHPLIAHPTNTEQQEALHAVDEGARAHRNKHVKKAHFETTACKDAQCMEGNERDGDSEITFLRDQF